MAPSDTWILALVELLYFVPASIPALYCLWVHRKLEILGWLYLSIFITLQVVGSAMIVAAGEHGTPSYIAFLLTGVGLSPLILAVAGVVHELAQLGGLVRTTRSKKWAWVIVIQYHLAIGGAVAIYAVGFSDTFDPASADTGKTLAKAGVSLLLLLFLLLIVVFVVVVVRVGVKASKALVWAVAVSLVLIMIRLVYQCVAAFEIGDSVFSPVTGSIVLRVVLQFLPGALTLAAMVCGGVLSRDKAFRGPSYRSVSTTVPLISKSQG